MVRFLIMRIFASFSFKVENVFFIIVQIRFCPSVFLYLASVCPSIWLIELDKLYTRLEKKESMEAAGATTTTTTTTTSTSILSSANEINASMDLGHKGLNKSNVDLGVLKDVGVRNSLSKSLDI